MQALTHANDDPFEKTLVRNEVLYLLNQLNRLQTAFMITVLKVILQRFQSVTVKLQSVTIDLTILHDLFE